MRDKNKLTHGLIVLLPESEYVSFKEARSTWWCNLRNNGGMRLTNVGYDIFCNNLDLEKYRFEINLNDIFNQHFILALDRTLQYPYYISIKQRNKRLEDLVNLMLFGGKEAVIANLYGGIKQFLDNYKIDK